MWNKLKYGLQRFMMGRNGGDTLSWVVLIASAVCSIAAGIEGFEWLTALSFIGLAYTIFRMYSRNVVKRRQENAKFVGFFKRSKTRLTDREHRYFKCPQCKQTVRVPKGKGTIKIRCPKCGNQFEKKS